MRRMLAILGLALIPLLIGSGADGAGGKPPRARQISYIYDLFDNSFVRPATRVLDPALLVRRATRNPREAANVDEQDQVRLPNTWWQPRAGFKSVSVQQLVHGPGAGLGPAPGKLTVTKAKTQGITPGLQIEDSRGDKFLLKFDPPKNPEMTTAADVIGSYVFWAAGFNVPENTIVIFRPEDLVLAKDATHRDAMGRQRPLIQEDLQRVLTLVARRPDGSFRAMASRYLSGKPLGPFDYRGRRKDDPEDRIPHQLRRELRGLWTICAWVNHADSRAPNSLDMWVEDHGRSFVRHYLLDFGSILGSSAIGPRNYSTGTEYYVDPNVIMPELLTLGFKRFEWEGVVDPKIPAVGFVESQRFNPADWRPDYPNAAFDERTERDIRWGTRIVAGFNDDLIRAAVGQARFSDPRASEYLIRVLIERRDKLIRRWLPGEEARLIVGRR